MTDHDDLERTDDDTEEPGFAGGGGPAAEIYGDDDAEADAHGDHLAAPDDVPQGDD